MFLFLDLYNRRYILFHNNFEDIQYYWEIVATPPPTPTHSQVYNFNSCRCYKRVYLIWWLFFNYGFTKYHIIEKNCMKILWHFKTIKLSTFSGWINIISAQETYVFLRIYYYTYIFELFESLKKKVFSADRESQIWQSTLLHFTWMVS